MIQEQRHQTTLTQQFSVILAPEVAHEGAQSPLWRELAAFPGVTGGQLFSQDHQLLGEFGALGNQVVESPLVNSGQLVGQLRLGYELPGQFWLVACSWLLLAGGLLWVGYRSRLSKKEAVSLRERAQASFAAPQPKEAAIDVGTQLSDSFIGKIVSQLGSDGHVLAEDPRAWEGLQQRVRELKEHYRSLCDHANNLIMVSDPEGLLVFANKSLLKLFPKVEVGSDLWTLFEGKTQATARDKFQQCLLQGEAMNFQGQLCLPQGPMHIEGSFCPGAVESGVTVTVLGIFRDMTQQIRAEEELRQAQKMEAVGRLAGGVAHDFNNLLTIMGSVSSLVRCEPEDSPERWEHLDMLDETVERAAALTRQLLLFSRRRTPACSPVQVDSVLADMVRLARRLLGEDVALHTDLQSDAWIQADASELEQVTMNLLVNARDAMPSGGRVDVRTRIVSWNEGEAVQMVFQDSGCGMPPELVERIFEPYFTTKEVGKGTGLGLSTTYGVIHRMQGAIEVQSSPGQGTSFIIHLPTIEPVEELADDSSEESPQATNREWIVLVEDEERLCSATTKTLRTLGYEVTPSLSPGEALAGLEASHRCPNILVTDLIMPGMNGAELAKQARNLHPDLKVLFVSGYPGDALEGLDTDGFEFLPKPYRLEELHRRIRGILDGSKVAS